MTHGTRYAYNFHSCRCAECRAHMAALRALKRDRTRDYMTGYRARNREKLRDRNREWMRRYRAELRKVQAA